MKQSSKPRFRRILLKLSGEALGGETGVGICAEAINRMAQQIREVRQLGVQVVVVVGGGNIFRGLQGSQSGIERATGDYMGMLATVINALALQDALERTGTPRRGWPRCRVRNRKWRCSHSPRASGRHCATRQSNRCKRNSSRKA